MHSQQSDSPSSVQFLRCSQGRLLCILTAFKQKCHYNTLKYNSGKAKFPYMWEVSQQEFTNNHCVYTWLI